MGVPGARSGKNRYGPAIDEVNGATPGLQARLSPGVTRPTVSAVSAQALGGEKGSAGRRHDPVDATVL